MAAGTSESMKRVRGQDHPNVQEKTINFPPHFSLFLTLSGSRVKYFSKVIDVKIKKSFFSVLFDLFFFFHHVLFFPFPVFFFRPLTMTFVLYVLLFFPFTGFLCFWRGTYELFIWTVNSLTNLSRV